MVERIDEGVSLMWEEFEEDYTDPTNGSVFSSIPGIRREDGFTLLSHRLDKEGFQTFVCRGNFGEFRFYARRWYGEMHYGKELETYTVQVNRNPDRGYADKEIHRERVLKHAKDIEAGLLVFPYKRAYSKPVKNVVFDVSRIVGVPELVRAEDI